MHEDFQLPVIYKGKELSYTARLLRLGYIYKIEVEVNDSIVHFERDDEGNWRVLLSEQDVKQGRSVDKELLVQMIASIDQITG